jgi:aminoglycoside 6'-N-acetyltransferase I
MRVLLWPEHAAEDLAADLDSMLADALSPVFVAEREAGGLCGLLEAGTRRYADGCSTSPVGYIEGWYVDADVRGMGIGRHLVSAAEAWAREQGLREMASDALISNEPSLKAHLALGYEEKERLVHFAKIL